jgi:fluoride exporter
MIVGIGGFFGTILRMELKDRGNPDSSGDFPIGTFAANTIACLFLGAVLQILDHQALRLFFISGFLGSLSTYSTFIMELTSMQSGAWRMAIIYTMVSIGVGVIAMIAGYHLAG